jgi:integrase
MRWENVDRRHRLIRVDAGYVKNREVRSVPMNEVLTQTLQDSTLSQPTGPVFRNRTGQPYRDPDSAFDTAVRRAGIMEG